MGDLDFISALGYKRVFPLLTSRPVCVPVVLHCLTSLRRPISAKTVLKTTKNRSQSPSCRLSQSKTKQTESSRTTPQAVSVLVVKPSAVRNIPFVVGWEVEKIRRKSACILFAKQIFLSFDNGSSGLINRMLRSPSLPRAKLRARD